MGNFFRNPELNKEFNDIVERIELLIEQGTYSDIVIKSVLMAEIGVRVTAEMLVPVTFENMFHRIADSIVLGRYSIEKFRRHFFSFFFGDTVDPNTAAC